MVTVNCRADEMTGSLAGREHATARALAEQPAGDRSERIVFEEDALTGPRLKYYWRTADVDYWTSLWRQHAALSYERELNGHLPHQLRGTFRRWVPPGSRILEAGCGPGRFTVASHALGYRAEGLDWSAETIETLRSRFPWIHWHLGDVRAIHCAAGEFDAVYLPGVCEHFEEGPADILAEVRRVLRQSGIAVVSTPCFNAWLQRNVDRVTAAVEGSSREFYQYAFTPDGMTRLLDRLGFDVVQVRPYGVLETFTRYATWQIPSPWRNLLGFGMDYLPVVRQWGSTCIWVGRKR